MAVVVKVHNMKNSGQRVIRGFLRKISLRVDIFQKFLNVYFVVAAGVQTRPQPRL